MAEFYLVLIIIQPLCFSLWMYATGRIREHVIYDLREDMFNKLQHLSHSFFDKVASGWITIRLTSDVDKVAQVISWGFISLIYGVTMITASLIVMFFFNIPLTLIVLFTIPVLLILAIRIRLLLLKHARKARKLYSEMAANLTENINGVEVNKATVQELRAGQNFQKSVKTSEVQLLKQVIILYVSSCGGHDGLDCCSFGDLPGWSYGC